MSKPPLVKTKHRVIHEDDIEPLTGRGLAVVIAIVIAIVVGVMLWR